MIRKVIISDKITGRVIAEKPVLTHIWWIGDKTGSIGSWSTKEDAEEAIKAGLKSGFLNPKKDWKPIKHKIAICPSCGKLKEKDIIEGLGECLDCDHIMGDVMFG